MSATNATLFCSVGAALSPPGDCTKARHRELKQNVGRHCKTGKKSCDASTTCDEMPGNIERGTKCAEARLKIMVECFRGGDATHKRELATTLAVVANCQELFNKNCRKQPVPDPVPVPVPVPNPAPEPTPDPGSGIDLNALAQKVALALGISVGAAMLLILAGVVVLAPVGA